MPSLPDLLHPSHSLEMLTLCRGRFTCNLRTEATQSFGCCGRALRIIESAYSDKWFLLTEKCVHRYVELSRLSTALSPLQRLYLDLSQLKITVPSPEALPSLAVFSSSKWYYFSFSSFQENLNSAETIHTFVRIHFTLRKVSSNCLG